MSNGELAPRGSIELALRDPAAAPVVIRDLVRRRDGGQLYELARRAIALGNRPLARAAVYAAVTGGGAELELGFPDEMQPHWDAFDNYYDLGEFNESHTRYEVEDTRATAEQEGLVLWWTRLQNDSAALDLLESISMYVPYQFGTSYGEWVLSVVGEQTRAMLAAGHDRERIDLADTHAAFWDATAAGRYDHGLPREHRSAEAAVEWFQTFYAPMDSPVFAGMRDRGRLLKVMATGRGLHFADPIDEPIVRLGKQITLEHLFGARPLRMTWGRESGARATLPLANALVGAAALGLLLYFIGRAR